MKIINAEFFKSYEFLKNLPKDKKHEIAVVGRSNVGKSSLINMLLGRKDLAKASQTPGKTKMINYFSVNNESWYLVDLPGYGWAKLSYLEKEKLGKMIQDYVLNREELSLLLVLIDSRLEPQKIDLDFINEVGSQNIPIALAFTKADKLSKTKVEKNVKIFLENLKISWQKLPLRFITSSVSSLGKEDLLKFFSSFLKN